MVLKEAIITRINEICKEKGKAVNEICLNGGLTPSTYYDFVNNRTKLPKIDTIQRICVGADITISEFFNRDYFNEIEEI